MTLAGGLVDRRVRALFQLGENVTFEEFMISNHGKDSLALRSHERDGVIYWDYALSETRVAKSAWEAATKAEREACAEACLDWAAKNATWPAHVATAKQCAEVIRTRSNGPGKPPAANEPNKGNEC